MTTAIPYVVSWCSGCTVTFAQTRVESAENVETLRINLPLIAVRVVSAFAQFTPRPVGSPQRYAGGLGRFARARPDAQQFVHAPANGVEKIE